MATTKSQLSPARRQGAFAKIEQLPVLADVLEMLQKGQSFDSVAIWIQQQGHFKDKQSRTLSRQLSRFWKQRGEEKAPEVIAHKQAVTVDEIEKLERLAQLQEERLQIITENEKTIGHLFPHVRQDIGELKSIYHLIIDKKQSLGVYAAQQQQPQTVINNVTNVTENNNVVKIDRLDTKIQAVISDQKSRRRLLNAVEALARPERDPDEAFAKRFHTGDRGQSEEFEEITVGQASG